MSPVWNRTVHALDHDYSAAFTLGAGVCGALVWSALNSQSYRHAVDYSWSGRLSNLSPLNSAHGFVISGLMTIFFFAIGLELAREINDGTFTRTSRALAPVLGALGGMALTAVLSVAIGNVTSTAALRHGWGVPMATDIAFALGALALAGRGLPPTLRLFLLTLAVADDVFSVVILAGTGVSHLRPLGLGFIVMATLVTWRCSRRFRSTPWRLGVLALLWLCFVFARVEPPLAGVLAGLVVPFERATGPLEMHVRRWSTGLVLPLFALVSCGIQWTKLSGHTATTIVGATIVIRIVGKVIGVTVGAALARRLGFPYDPSLTGRLLVTSSLLCAVGFTVPLLFAGALYGRASPTYGAFTVGLLISSLIAAILGVTLLRRQARSLRARGDV